VEHGIAQHAGRMPGRRWHDEDAAYERGIDDSTERQANFRARWTPSDVCRIAVSFGGEAGRWSLALQIAITAGDKFEIAAPILIE